MLELEHEVVDEGIEALAQRMRRLGRQLADGVGHGRDDLARGGAGGHLVEPDVAQRLDLPRDGFGDAALQLFAFDQPGDLTQHVVEQRLMTATGGERVQRLAEQSRQVDLGQPRRDCATEEVAHPRVVERAQAVARCRHRVVAQRAGVCRGSQPVGQPRSRVELLQLRQHLRGAQEVVADEAREVGADAVLVGRDDRGVRNGQAERMPKQRDHREPVGDGADHRGLGKSRDVAEPRMARLEGFGQRVQQRGGDEQAERDAFQDEERPEDNRKLETRKFKTCKLSGYRA